jgi:mandelamide amidase
VLDTVITDTKEAVVPATLKGLRLGVPKALNDGVDAETARVIGAALARMKSAGVVLVDADVPDLLALNAKVGFPVALYEVTIDLPAYAQRYGIGLDFKGFAEKVASPDVKGLFAALARGEPPSVTKSVYDEAIKVHRPMLQKAYAGYFARHKVAAMVFPTTPLAAAPIGDDQETELDGKKVPTFPTFIRNTDPGSNAGLPGLSVPAGLTRAGLPVGLELDGPVGSDRKLLAIGLALEKLLGPLPAPK